ncbi:hypothetical protein EDC01DRAFT_631343 [Geopyxis carbonaria]|nr:hypothetical protein EDC01DRAFT_631343 [Geopyxis carbonaria]
MRNIKQKNRIKITCILHENAAVRAQEEQFLSDQQRESTQQRIEAHRARHVLLHYDVLQCTGLLLMGEDSGALAPPSCLASLSANGALRVAMGSVEAITRTTPITAKLDTHGLPNGDVRVFVVTNEQRRQNRRLLVRRRRLYAAFGRAAVCLFAQLVESSARFRGFLCCSAQQLPTLDRLTLRLGERQTLADVIGHRVHPSRF